MKFQAQTAQLEDHRSTWDREPDEYKPRVSNPRKTTDTDLLATLKAQLRSAESKLVAIEKKGNGGGTAESNNAKKKRLQKERADRLQKERADQRRGEDIRSKDRRDTNDRGNTRTNNDEDKEWARYMDSRTDAGDNNGNGSSCHGHKGGTCGWFEREGVCLYFHRGDPDSTGRKMDKKHHATALKLLANLRGRGRYSQGGGGGGQGVVLFDAGCAW